MRSGIWKVRSLCRSGSLTTVARELARYKLDLVGVQDVKWDKEGRVRTGNYSLILWKRKRKPSVAKRIFVHHRLISTVKRVDFVSDRTSYIVLRGHWCNIIVLNVHAKKKKKSDDSKNIFYEGIREDVRSFP
jgi:hypothetical protein